MGGEDGDRALGDLVAQLVDEDRAAGGELLHDVLVVDDLLAHVDRRAVQLERALDGLDGAVDAGAVAARGGEQQLLGSGGHGPLQCTNELEHRLPRLVERALADRARGRRRARASTRTATRSGRSPGTPARRNGVWSSVIALPVPGGNARAGADRLRAARRSAPTAPGPSVASRWIRIPLPATKSSRISARELAAVALARTPWSRAGRSRRTGASRRSPPRRRTARSGAAGAPCGRSRRAARGRAPRPRRCRRAVVGADEAGQVLGVVVRGDDDRRLAARAGCRRRCAARVPGHALEAAARAAPRAQPLGEPPQRRASRPGAGRARPGGAAPPTRARSRSGRRSAPRPRGGARRGRLVVAAVAGERHDRDDRRRRAAPRRARTINAQPACPRSRRVTGMSVLAVAAAVRGHGRRGAAVGGRLRLRARRRAAALRRRAVARAGGRAA